MAIQAEILALRRQLNILRRKSPKRVVLRSIDRLLLVGLYRLAPEVLDALKIIRPETLMRWSEPSPVTSSLSWSGWRRKQHGMTGVASEN